MIKRRHLEYFVLQLLNDSVLFNRITGSHEDILFELEESIHHILWQELNKTNKFEYTMKKVIHNVVIYWLSTKSEQQRRGQTRDLKVVFSTL